MPSLWNCHRARRAFGDGDLFSRSMARNHLLFAVLVSAFGNGVSVYHPIANGDGALRRGASSFDDTSFRESDFFDRLAGTLLDRCGHGIPSGTSPQPGDPALSTPEVELGIGQTRRLRTTRRAEDARLERRLSEVLEAVDRRCQPTWSTAMRSILTCSICCV